MEAEPLILIVDDDPVLRGLMRDALEDERFRVIEADNGIDACRQCENSLPDLVVADVVMPVMDGFELCRSLRRRPATAHLPILVATGLDDLDSIATAYEAGATDFIPKPLNWVILIHRIRYMLRAARATRELRQSQERLRAAKNLAEAADRAKSEFLANVSHELRTPLNAIIGFSTIMSTGMFGPLNERYLDYAGSIVQSGTHLLSVINDILDIAKAESQSLDLAEQPVEISHVVTQCARMTREMAAKAGIESRLEMEDGLPVFTGDAVKLRQILINLMSNAIKFTPEGGTIVLAAKRGRTGGLQLSVRDTGIGIPPDKMSVALAPFGQVDSALNRKYPGMGLGLPLTKRLVELHGGSLEITSPPGGGTLVTVLFPPDRVGDKNEPLAPRPEISA